MSERTLGVGEALVLEVESTSKVSVVEEMCGECVLVVVLVGDTFSVSVVVLSVGGEGGTCGEVTRTVG